MKAMKSMNEQSKELYGDTTVIEPKVKWVHIPDFRFYKDNKWLKEILDKELESKVDP